MKLLHQEAVNRCNIEETLFLARGGTIKKLPDGPQIERLTAIPASAGAAYAAMHLKGYYDENDFNGLGTRLAAFLHGTFQLRPLKNRGRKRTAAGSNTSS